LEQSFAAHVPLPTANGTLVSGRRCYSSPEWCYLHHLCTALG